MRLRLAPVLAAATACGPMAHPASPPVPSPVHPERGGEAAESKEPVRATMPPAATATKIREMAGITEYRLSNGLQVLLFPDPSQSTITVNITYLVGSRVEGYGET